MHTSGTTSTIADARAPRFLAWFARHASVIIALVGACMLAAYVTSVVAFPKPGGRILLGDAAHEYVQLRSLVFDRDLQFRNDYFRLYNLRGGEWDTLWITSDLTATGHVRNYMPVGPALLWAPLYLLVAGVQLLLSLAGLVPPPDGFGAALQLVPGVAGILAATTTVWLSMRLARRWADATSGAVAAIAVWLGTSAIYYSLISPAYSHTASMLATAIFFTYWLSVRDTPSVRRFAALGALAGVAALMRWQDVVLLAVPMLDLLCGRLGWRQRLVNGAVAGLAWLVAFSPQMVVWQVLYGKPFAIPQGPSFMQWTKPHGIDVLLSDNHGLFSWTPLALVCIAGLAVFLWRRRLAALPLAFVVLASWYINAAVADWWAGEAFGARRFLSLFPLFVIGLATWLRPQAESRPRIGRIAIVAALVALNLLLVFQYQLFMKGLSAVAPYPRGWFGLGVARLIVPFRLVSWWLR